MFWIWMILEVVWTVCESSVESFLKSNKEGLFFGDCRHECDFGIYDRLLSG